MDPGSCFPFQRRTRGCFTVENDKCLVGRIANLDFDSIWVDSADARKCDVICGVDEWSHSLVKSSSQKQGVYEDVCQSELYITALERETDGGPCAWDRCR